MHGEERKFDFPAYLEAKYAVDSASLNAALFCQFTERLLSKSNPRVLDLGTGTGAMIQRLLDLELRGQVQFVGIDREDQNLTAGFEHIQRVLIDKGYLIREQQANYTTKWIHARKGKNRLHIELLCGDLLQGKITGNLGSFDCITAHAFMDLMPLEQVVASIGTLLKAEGLFYSTLNYDGQTVLLPEYREPRVEQRLLRIYNNSMEKRLAGGTKTGGAFSGRRLYQALLQGGYRMLGLGASDWTVFPLGDAYSEQEKLFLETILNFIAGEAQLNLAGEYGGEDQVEHRYGGLPSKVVADWHSERREDVQNSRLCLIVHQLDLLATLSSPSPSPI